MIEVLFVGEGGLGNQVIHAAMLLAKFPRSSILATSLGRFSDLFEKPGRMAVPKLNRPFDIFLRRLVVPVVLKPLFKWLRIGTYCTETTRPVGIDGSDGPTGAFVRQPGLSGLTFINGGHFQNLSNMLELADFQKLKLKPELLDRGRALLAKSLEGHDGSNPRVVMHVRRGDYVGYRTYGLNDVTLPVAYFERAVQHIRITQGYKDVVVIVSDDKAWCIANLSAVAPFVVISSSEAVDFALISLFPIAIVANSTFSLSAACVSPNNEMIIAPKYWFGHAVGKWLPPAIESREARFIYM